MKANTTIHLLGIYTRIPFKVTIRKGKIKSVLLEAKPETKEEKFILLREARLTAHHKLFDNYAICPACTHRYLIRFKLRPETPYLFSCTSCKEQYDLKTIECWMYHKKAE